MNDAGGPQPRTGTSRTTLRTALRSSAIRVLAGFPLTLVALPLILSQVSTADYGIWVTVSSLLSVAGLVDGGVRAETTRRVAVALSQGDVGLARRVAAQGATLLLGVGSLLLVGAALVAEPLVRAVFSDLSGTTPQDVETVFLATMVVLVLTLSSNAWYALLDGAQRPEYANYAVPLTTLTSAAVTLVATQVVSGLHALLAGLAAATAVRVVTLSAGLRRVLPGVGFRPAGLAGAAGFVGVSVTLVVTQLCTIIDYQFDKVLLAHYVSTEAAAQYQIGTQLPLQAYAIALLPANLLLAGLAELLVSDSAKAARLYDAAARLTVVVGAGLFGGTLLLGPSFTVLWLGDDFGQAGTAAALLSISMLLNIISAPWYFHCLAVRALWVLMVSAASNAAVNSVCSWVLTANLGFEGALYGSIAGNAAGLLVFRALVGRTRPSRRWLGPGVTAVTAGLLAAGLVRLMAPSRPDVVPVLVSGALYVAVFVLLAVATGLLRPAEARTVLGREGRRSL